MSAESNVLGAPAAESATKANGRVKRPSTSLSSRRWELIDACVRATQSIGIPRSIGEIFGVIFSSDLPLSFDDVVDLLGISAGSASHGLRALRRMGAINTVYQPRDHRDYYLAETSLRKLLNGFLAEVVLLHLGGSKERLESLASDMKNEAPEASEPLLREITELLLNWNRQVGTAFRAAMEALQ